MGQLWAAPQQSAAFSPFKRGGGHTGERSWISWQEEQLGELCSTGLSSALPKEHRVLQELVLLCSQKDVSSGSGWPREALGASAMLLSAVWKSAVVLLFALNAFQRNQVPCNLPGVTMAQLSDS